MKKNLVLEKSYRFSLRIVKLCAHLYHTKGPEILIVRQLIRSGTSIGANIEEAVGASSRNEFIYKMNISYREARETYYWLRLLHDAGFLELKFAESFKRDCMELIKLIGTIQKSLKKQTSAISPQLRNS